MAIWNDWAAAKSPQIVYFTTERWLALVSSTEAMEVRLLLTATSDNTSIQPIDASLESLDLLASDDWMLCSEDAWMDDSTPDFDTVIIEFAFDTPDETFDDLSGFAAAEGTQLQQAVPQVAGTLENANPTSSGDAAAFMEDVELETAAAEDLWLDNSSADLDAAIGDLGLDTTNITLIDQTGPIGTGTTDPEAMLNAYWNLPETQAEFSALQNKITAHNTNWGNQQNGLITDSI